MSDCAPCSHLKTKLALIALGVFIVVHVVKLALVILVWRFLW